MSQSESRGPLRYRTLAYGFLAAIALIVVVSLSLWRANESRVDPARERAGSAERVENSRSKSGPLAKPEEDDARKPLWQAVEETAVANPPPYAAEWSTAGRALVRISSDAFAAEAWRVGDSLTIPLPQLGETYRGAIEEIDDGAGARALVGKIVGNDGRARRYVVTVGPTSLFAYIDTPDEPYELVANARYGWLLPSSSMMAGWDFSKPDYILPDMKEAPELQ